MSRRHRSDKRDVLPDAKFKDEVVSKFMSCLMYDGKRSTAESIVYGAFDKIESKMGQQPVTVFHEALNNVRPVVEVRSRRVGGATYQVPIEVARKRRFYLASQWLINAAESRKGKPMSSRLALEFISAANGDGGAIKKKDDTHRMAEANKAFAHFR